MAPYQIMLGAAWATLPDLPTYRTGVIMVGLARYVFNALLFSWHSCYRLTLSILFLYCRCIAMVMIWNQLAQGDTDYCAIIVIINSILQIILYSPMCLLFISVISHEEQQELEYGKTAIAVLIYLGIPLAAGMVTRFIGLKSLGETKFYTKFLPYFGPLALIGLLYTLSLFLLDPFCMEHWWPPLRRHSIILIFAEQADRILSNIGNVFRVFVPMILYFVIMWSMTFFLIYKLTIRKGGAEKWGYKMAVVQVSLKKVDVLQVSAYT